MKQFTIVLLIISFSSLGQNISFSRLTEEDGLPGNSARCFLKDNKGFIWIGTASGLCRYDGYEIVSYSQEQGYNISNDYINAIIQDKDGIIWLGTNAGGLNAFNPETEKFQTFRNNPKEPKSIAGDRIQSLEEGKDGTIWIGFDNGFGLSHFDIKSGKSTNYDPFESVQLSGVKAIRSIVLDKWDPNRLWLGTTSGLILFDIENEEFTLINHPLTPQNRHGLFALDQIDENRLVTGLFHAGTDVYYIKEKQWQESYQELSKTIRTCDLAKKSDTEYWVAARKRGLAILNIESGELQFVKSDINNQNTPFPDFTYSVYSESDRVWTGSKHGVSYSKKSSNTFPFLPLEFTSEEFGKVSDISGKFDKTYIVGLHGKGLWEIDKISEEIKIYTTVPEIISGMLETKNGIYLVDERARIFHFDKQTTQTTQINTSAIPKETASISILEGWDSDNALVITRFGGIFSLSYSSNKLKNLLNGGLADQWLHDALIHDDGTIWIGTNSAVSIYYPQQDSVTLYYPQSIASKNEKHILTIKKDAFGKIWMGTGHGLLKLENGKETLYTALNSDLAGNSVSQIAFDSNDDLWVTTSKGVTYIDQQTMQMINYDRSDGIDIDGVLKSIDGVIYYGDNQGYYILSERFETKNSDPVHIYLTGFQVENAPLNLPKSIGFTKEMNLDYWQNSFSFSYSSPVFNQPQRLTYAYRLMGLNDTWTYTEKRRFANFTNLDGGDYVFEVKAKTRDSPWSEPTSVMIHLATPYWETWWFYSLCGLLILGSGLAVYKVRIKALQRKADLAAQELRVEALQKRLMDLNISPSDLQVEIKDLNTKLQTPLSEREFEILKLTVDGKSNPEISEKLFISISTVKFHLTNTYSKLGVSNRKEALDYVVKKT